MAGRGQRDGKMREYFSSGVSSCLGVGNAGPGRLSAILTFHPLSTPSP